MVVESVSDSYNFNHINRGFFTNFTPDENQLAVLSSTYAPLELKTLFTVEERKNGSVKDLIAKQILHYLEVNLLKTPGLFELEVSEGKMVSMSYVRGVTAEELKDMVRTLLYSNAPVKDAIAIMNIINAYDIDYQVSEIKNNELKVLLFNADKDVFDNGDDAVRYIVYKTTDQSLLIKSSKVITLTASNKNRISNRFLKNHARVLANVFNRHKKIILSLKNESNKTIINKISRMSKTDHIPVRESFVKRFINESLEGRIHDYSVVDSFSIRDKFKFLNLLEYKKIQSEVDAFVIRNGKVHIEQGRKTYKIPNIEYVQERILESLAKDLVDLKTKSILLDAKVDYGLPSTRKQAMGNLPFGTTITVDSEEISSGIYWENAWGAIDLDLSTIDKGGNRTGWGAYSGYGKNAIQFSGDLVDARNGAMEFMTSKVDFKQTYGLFVNIFNGQEGAGAELVIGTKTGKKWIDEFVIREKIKLESRGTILGFVKDGKFIVYSTRLNNRSVSGGNSAIIQRGLSGFWTVRKLFDSLNIEYDLDVNPKITYNNDLSYNGFSYDKLENLLGL